MFCRNCGKALAEGAKFCVECGSKVEIPVSQTDEVKAEEVQEEVKAEEAKAEEAKAEEAKTEETKAEEAKAEEVKAEEVQEEAKAEEVKAEEAKTEEAKTEETKAEEAKAEETKVEEAQTEEVKAEEIKVEEVKAEEAKTEEPKVEEVKAEETKAEEAKTEEAKPEEPKTEETKSEETKSDEAKAKKAKQRKRKGGAGCAILSVLATLLIIVLGTAASVIFLLGKLTARETTDAAISCMSIPETELGFLEDSKEISDLIWDNLDPQWKDEYAIRKKDLEKLLEEEFVQEFVSGKVGDYVEDLLKDTGDGVIRAEEIADLLEENKDIIEEHTGYRLQKEDLRRIESEAGDYLEKTDISRYREDHTEVFLAVRYAVSYWTAAVLLALVLLLAVCLFVMQARKMKAFAYLGTGVVLVGAFHLAAVGMSDFLISLLNRNVGLGRSFWRQLLDPVKSRALLQGGILVAVGILFCLIGALTGKRRKKHEVAA